MNNDEILSTVIVRSKDLTEKYQKAHAAMMAAVYAGDIPARDEHRKVLEEMKPEIQAKAVEMLNWATAQFSTRYTGGAMAEGHGRGRVCMAPSYAAPVKWDDAPAYAYINAPLNETFASAQEALDATVAGAGGWEGVIITVRDHPDPNDRWDEETVVVSRREGRKTLAEALEAADPKWGLTGFGEWEWTGHEITAEDQARSLVLNGMSPFRSIMKHDGEEFLITVR